MTSPNNWGLTGHKPTHPKLLDHLAVRFMSENWSVKKLIRTIALSDTYQRSSVMNLANYEVDPDNKLLWRSNPRPLDAEALRDTILTAGGGLDLKRPYGSQVSAFGDKRVGLSFNPRQDDDRGTLSISLPAHFAGRPARGLGSLRLRGSKRLQTEARIDQRPLAGPLPDEQQMGLGRGCCHGKESGQALPRSRITGQTGLSSDLQSTTGYGRPRGRKGLFQPIQAGGSKSGREETIQTTPR